jgi:hypothetical protein
VVTRDFRCAVGLLLLLATSATSTDRNDARTFLTTVFNVSGAEVDRIDSGQVIARSLGTTDPREVATLGVVRIHATPEFYVKRLADIVKFKGDEAVLQIGKFGNRPKVEDMAALTLDDWDIRKLRECQIASCGIQLSVEGIERFRKDVDWRRPDAPLRATDLMRQILVEYVTRYRETGGVSAMRYADQSEPIDMGREFTSLVESDVVWRHFGGLRRHLLEFPNAHTPQTTDILYWSKERVSRRLVVSVTHLAISRPMEGSAEYAIASKQIYGTHYFEASLGLTVLLRDHSSPSPAMYLVYLNRSRVDVFNGMFGSIARRLVTTRARSLVSEQLGRLQRSMAHQFAASSG